MSPTLLRDAPLSDRTSRYLRRVNHDIAGLDALERTAYLDRLIENWERRYRNFIRTEGKSEFCADPSNPIDASDFQMTITALGARRDALRHSADCRCRICSFPPLYIDEAV